MSFSLIPSTPSRTPWLAGAFALLLAACSIPDFAKFPEEVTLDCPGITVLDDAANLTRFSETGGQDLTDVSFEAQIVGAKGSCGYDIDGNTGPGTLDFEIAFAFELSRGPAARASAIVFDYFVGITDREGRILNKSIFPVKLAIETNRPRLILHDKPVQLQIFLKDGQTGEDYYVISGFQLNQRELDYNRRKLRTGN